MARSAQPLPEQPIEQLVAQAAAGRHDAWQVLVTQLSPRVFGLLVRQCGDRDLAEELTQATFVRIVTRLHGYREQGQFEPWLFRIAINLLRDELRRRRRQPRAMSLTPTEDQHSGDDASWLTATQPNRSEPVDAHDPLAQASRAEQHEQVRRAVAQLGEADQQVLHLRHTAGLTFAQIAETLDEPLGTVLARGHRALKKLRTILDASGMIDD